MWPTVPVTYPPPRVPTEPVEGTAMWPTVPMTGMPHTLQEIGTAMRIEVAVARGPPRGAVLPAPVRPVSTRSIICEVPFERESMRHIPILLLNLMGMVRSRGQGAKKFKIGPSSKWQVYKYTAQNHLVCCCRNVHAWYYCRFDPEFADEGFTAALPENPTAFANDEPLR